MNPKHSLGVGRGLVLRSKTFRRLSRRVHALVLYVLRGLAMKRSVVSPSLLAAFVLGLAIWLNVSSLTAVAFAQEPQEVQSKPAALVEAMPTLRTPKVIEQSESQLRSTPTFVKPFMPTMDPARFDAEKAAANLQAQVELQVVEALEPKPLSPPTLRAINFAGINQTVAGGSPPDTHGAVGLSHFVQVVNFRVVVYDKTGTGTPLSNRSLQNFFGSTERLFDPRVVFDRIWNRWVIVATRQSTAAADPNQFYFLAVSRTSDPTGDYFIYRIGFRAGAVNDGDWWDFPQLGMDQDAVIVTGNIFDGPVLPPPAPSPRFKFAAMTPFAKAAIYNGLGVVYPVFTDLRGTLAPPIVLDNNNRAFLVAAADGRSLHLYRGENLSTSVNAILTLQSAVNVTDYDLPADARQCNTTELLDTADYRFVNASTQVGDSLWNVHTVRRAGAFSAKPVFYEIDTEGAGRNSIKQTGRLSGVGPLDVCPSFDFNASIAVNDFSEVFVTWSSTRPRALFGLCNCVNAQVRFSGRQPSDAPGVIPSGSALQTSNTALTAGSEHATDPNVQRWGDYSAVTLDPEATAACLPGRRAWLVNEEVVNANTWGSRIGRIGFCE